MVLATRRRGAEPTGQARRTLRWGLPLSADDDDRGGAEGSGPGGLVTEFRRLLVSGLQHEHCLFADRCTGTGEMGENPDDVAIAALTADHRVPSRTRRQHSINAIVVAYWISAIVDRVTLS